MAYGCSFVFCHHRRKPSLAGNDPANMFRGSSEIRAFVDCHLDLKPVKGESGLVTVGHAKSRYAEPVAPFDVEIVDTAKGETVVRYAGETKSQVQEKEEQAREFLRQLLSDGERHSRKDYQDAGVEAGYGRDLLDRVRKELVDAGEAEEFKEGNRLMVALKKSSYCPDIYKGRTEDFDGSEGAEGDEVLPDWVREDSQSETTVEQDVDALIDGVGEPDG